MIESRGSQNVSWRTKAGRRQVLLKVSQQEAPRLQDIEGTTTPAGQALQHTPARRNAPTSGEHGEQKEWRVGRAA